MYFNLIIICLLFFSCRSELEYLGIEKVIAEVKAKSIEVNGPSPSTGDQNTEFVYQVKFNNIENFELLSDHINQESSDVTCSDVEVTNGSSANPTITLKDCQGSGELSISLQINDESFSEVTMPEAELFSVTPTYIYRIDKLALANNRSSCAIDSTSKLKCWGSNYDSDDNVNGLLGTNDATNSYETTFQDVDSLNDYKHITRGEIINCGIRNDDKVYCWGKSWATGDASNSSDIRVPTIIDDTDTYISVHSGSYHTCGVTSAHDIKCWGDSWGGKLGRSGENKTPLVSDSGTKFQQIVGGRNHSCGITLEGKLRCFGYNSNGQIGVGNTTSPQSPVTIDENESYKFISSMENVTCAITTAGALKCWGSNSDAQTGIGTNGGNTLVPTHIDTGEKYESVSVGWRHACAITENKKLKCWGRNSNGQIGNGTTTGPMTSPTLIDGSSDYKVVNAGILHTCALKENDDLFCWGNNSLGELGDGTTTQRTSPTLIQTNF